MKFSHLADCHIGSWREEKLGNCSTEAFTKALDISIEEAVDFILIAGDIFNTSLPGIEKVKIVTKKLREVKEKGIPIYIIPGSHDFSPTGKTMVDVLEHAGLWQNVMKGVITEQNKLKLQWTTDKKTGVKITGMLGKKGMLEKKWYEQLDYESVEQEEGEKVFLFHSAIAELKPEGLEHMDAQPLSLLPKGCTYYAGGHVHFPGQWNNKEYAQIGYAGPLFPNSIAELEKLKHGGFYIYNNNQATYRPIILHPTVSIIMNAENEKSTEVQKKVLQTITETEMTDAIVVIRIFGELGEGKTSDIDWKRIKQQTEERGAWHMMRNTSQLRTKEFREIMIHGETTEDIEEKVFQEHCGQFQSSLVSKEDQQLLTKNLFKIFNTEKHEGERIIDFENRLKKEAEEILSI